MMATASDGGRVYSMTFEMDVHPDDPGFVQQLNAAMAAHEARYEALPVEMPSIEPGVNAAGNRAERRAAKKRRGR